jgi:hypothetical protein
MKVDFLIAKDNGLAPALKNNRLHSQNLCIKVAADVDILNGQNQMIDTRYFHEEPLDVLKLNASSREAGQN